MERDKKRIIAGAAVLGGTALGVLLWKKGREEGVPPPPAEDYGRIWGYIKNEQTDERVGGANVYLDGTYEDTTDKNGMYGTGYVQFGTHTLVVTADNYERLDAPITIAEESAKVEIRMAPLSEAPTDWTAGIEITKLTVDPLVAYVGEGIEIKIYTLYPAPLPLPADIHGTVLVNGTPVSGTWTIDRRNPILRLEYITTAPGNFTVRVLDKSANFQVETAATGTYYMPWGGSRMPLCTDIAIPAAPFKLEQGGQVVYDHPGGALLYSELYETHRIPGGAGVTTFTIYYPFDRVPEVLAGLALARPVAWNPPNATVSEFAIAYSQESRPYHAPYVTIMAVEYTCQPYWGSLQELAAVIANGLGYAAYKVPEEWIEKYGTTCPTCGGTGVEIYARRRERICRECRGSGKSLRVDLRRGWRDWVKVIKYGSICGAGACTPRLYCPYGDHYVEGAPHPGGLSWDVESFARIFLRHIEEKHPNHPLTEPAF